MLLGALFALWSYSYWLTGQFHLGSSRLYLAVAGTFLVGFIISYLLVFFVITPGIINIPVGARRWFVLVCFVLGAMIFAATINFETLQSRCFYFLLPEQSIEIKTIPNPELKNGDVTLLGFFTSIEEISYKEMDYTGWTRDELRKKRLSADNVQDNHVFWNGLTGYNANLIFETTPAGGRVEVAWNGDKKIYSLISNRMGTLEIPQNFSVPIYAGWLPLSLLMIFGFSLGVFTVFLTLFRLKLRLVRGSSKRFAWVYFALPMLVIWLFYWLVFYPGFMSSDSFSQWQQMETGFYMDWHPPIHTMTNWLITRVWHTPAAVSLVQLIAMSGVLGWGLAVIRRLGTPAWLTWLTSFILALSPANSTMAIVLWKDIPFSIAICALSIILLEMITSRGKWLDKKFNWIMFGVLLTLVALYRQNGILVSIGSGILLLISYRNYWKKAALALLLFATLFGVTKMGFFRLLNISSNDKARYQLVAYNLIAGHNHYETSFTPEEHQLVADAFPEPTIPYYCYRNINLNAKVDREYLRENTLPLISLAAKLSLRAPYTTIYHFSCIGDFVYRVVENTGHYYFSYLDIFPNEYGIKPESVIPGVKEPLVGMIQATMNDNKLSWFIWRSPFWMYLLLFGCIGACYRQRSWRNMLVMAPALLAILPLIILSLGEIFRYVYSMYLVGILFSGYYWTLAVSKDNSDKGNSF